ncbi:MAG TPA: histidinol-phosphatase [Burkholderiales bacterium]|nr:histidinol-phosphatase [Burkholderiales bacterium]
MRISESELRDFSIFAEELAEAAGHVISPYFRTSIAVEDKGGDSFDPVTLADRAAERTMREMISRRYPQHGIHGEEEGYLPGASPFTWVLDPIDGTRAFISGLPLWGTLIALNDGEQPCLGVMNQPYTDEQFLGTPEGAWLNGRPIKARSCPTLASAHVSCTSPQVFETPAQLAAFGRVAERARLVRYGGDCYAYCMLACGYVDAVIEAGLKPYDIQALMPIIQSAGGIVSTWDGGDPQHGGAIIACGDRRLHAEILNHLRERAPLT